VARRQTVGQAAPVDRVALLVLRKTAALEGQADPVVPVVLHRIAGLAALADRVALTSATLVAPAVLTVPAVLTSAGQMVGAVPAAPTSVARVAPAVLTSTISVAPTTMIGGRRGTQATTTGADGSTKLHGVADFRRGDGVHPRLRRGMDRCLTRGVRRRRPSTTGASRSNPFGIRVTTNGVSTSSGSGSHFPSDPTTGWPPRLCSGRPSASIQVSE
jgi:hypothetical protein